MSTILGKWREWERFKKNQIVRLGKRQYDVNQTYPVFEPMDKGKFSRFKKYVRVRAEE